MWPRPRNRVANSSGACAISSARRPAVMRATKGVGGQMTWCARDQLLESRLALHCRVVAADASARAVFVQHTRDGAVRQEWNGQAFQRHERRFVIEDVRQAVAAGGQKIERIALVPLHEVAHLHCSRPLHDLRPEPVIQQLQLCCQILRESQAPSGRDATPPDSCETRVRATRDQ